MMAPSLRMLTLRSLALLCCAGLTVVACSAGFGANGQEESEEQELVELGETGTGAGDTNGNTGGFYAGSDGGGDQGCAQAEVTPTPIAVTMLVAVDRSGSMADAGKWSAAKAAFTAFFTNPAADGLQVALSFWPFATCSDQICITAGCSVPTVSVGSLDDPGHEAALIGAFNIASPGGGTPMSTALGGACQWAVDRQLSHQGTERVVVVFLTDGEPTVCDLNVHNIAAQAAGAYAQAEVLTFAVGLQGSYEPTLDLIAQNGQTGQGFFIGSGNVQADLVNALNAIRETVMACSFAMPDSGDPNQPVDPTRVNVTFTSGGGSPWTIPQVPGEAQCGTGGGWYYDDPANPQSINLCDATCDSVQGDLDGRIEVVLGCTTQTY
ncbi:MAG: VWA domain-containing protein [Deltaproteobacteria bacterium]|nr:VWA domain-containing protein [Deltaproteobacteria bacterium]